MSDTDSFIDEVTEEVRRDRLYLLLRKYGWIAVLVIVLIVGGAAFNEYRKAQAQAAAERLGDEILYSIGLPDPGARLSALQDLSASAPETQAIVALLTASAALEAGDRDAAATALEAVPAGGDVAPIYGQIAAFKALVLAGDTLDRDSRRQQLEALAVPGAPLALLAQEQLGLMEIEVGNKEAALALFQSVLQDASASADLQQRVLQAIVALGGTPELAGLPGIEN